MIRSRFFLPLALVAFSTLNIGAEQLVQQRNWGALSPAFDSQTPAVDPLTFNQFNPSLGTLQSISVFTFVEHGGGSADLDAEGTLPTDITSRFGVGVDYTSTHVNLLDATFQPIGTDVRAENIQTFLNVAANDGDPTGVFDNDGGLDNRSMTVGTVNGSDSGFISPALHGSYIGTGTFDIDFAGQSFLNFSVPSTSGSFSPGLANGYVIVTYDYLASIPEPSTALALLAGAGIFAFRRRSRNSN